MGLVWKLPNNRDTCPYNTHTCVVIHTYTPVYAYIIKYRRVKFVTRFKSDMKKKKKTLRKGWRHFSLRVRFPFLPSDFNNFYSTLYPSISETLRFKVQTTNPTISNSFKKDYWLMSLLFSLIQKMTGDGGGGGTGRGMGVGGHFHKIKRGRWTRSPSSGREGYLKEPLPLKK